MTGNIIRRSRLILASTGEGASLKTLISASTLMAIALASGCVAKEEHRYAMLSDVEDESGRSVIAALSVPADATAIRVKSDAETGLYYISYDTSDATSAVREQRLSPVPHIAEHAVRGSLGFDESLPVSAYLYFRCDPGSDAPEAGARSHRGILMLGNAAGRQYQWNQTHWDGLESTLCNATEHT